MGPALARRVLVCLVGTVDRAQYGTILVLGGRGGNLGLLRATVEPILRKEPAGDFVYRVYGCIWVHMGPSKGMRSFVRSARVDFLFPM